MSRSENSRPRAFRRHQHWRMVARRWRQVRLWWCPGYTTPEDDFHDQMLFRVVRSAENRRTCSCYLCGNPRRISRRQTLQEDFAVLRHWEELLELDLAPLMKPPRFSPSVYLSRQQHFVERNLDADAGSE